MFEDLAKKIIRFFADFGVDPIYAATSLIVIVHMLFDFRKYKNWKSISTIQKSYTIIGLVAVLVFIALSTLNLLGYFNTRK